MHKSPFQNPYFMGFATLVMAAFTLRDFSIGQANGLTLVTFALFFICFGETLLALRKKK